MKTEATAIKMVKIADLVLDKSVQMRAAINRSAVCDYADAMEAGDEFPPIVVFHRFGGKHFVADGFHRVLAAKKLGRKTIQAEVRDGLKRDAVLFAAGANVTHGVRRTNEDKRKAVLSLLGDKEWVQWTDTTLAKACGVSVFMVARYRGWLKVPPEEEVRKYVDRTGRERTRTVPAKEEVLESIVREEICPYCQQVMPRKRLSINGSHK